MKKSLGILLAVVAVATLSAQVLAERGRRQRPETSSAPPPSANIKAAMEGVEWGWNHDKVVSHFSDQLKQLYRPLLNKATDAMTEDRLRAEMNARMGRIKESYVEFRGQRTGWDSSLIRDEYTQNNGESLVEVREIRADRSDPRYTDYFFFINDRLWKRFRAFNQDEFAGIPFETAAVSFQKRFGPAREVRGRNQVLTALEWEDATTRLRAIDNTEFYGVFCLVFSEKSTEAQLSKLRTNTGPQKRALSPLVESLDDGNEGDSHSNVVEHITGKRYNSAQPGKSKAQQQPR